MSTQTPIQIRRLEVSVEKHVIDRWVLCYFKNALKDVLKSFLKLFFTWTLFKGWAEILINIIGINKKFWSKRWQQKDISKLTDLYQASFNDPQRINLHILPEIKIIVRNYTNKKWACIFYRYIAYCFGEFMIVLWTTYIQY